jgi:hypothetical protein
VTLRLASPWQPTDAADFGSMSLEEVEKHVALFLPATHMLLSVIIVARVQVDKLLGQGS